MKFAKFLLPLIVFVIAMPVLAFGNVNVTVEDKKVDFAGQDPKIVSGRTLVPVRGVFEMLGFYVRWNEATRQVILMGDNVIVITLDSNVFTTDGREHTMEVPAQSIGGRTLLPIRAVLESVGLYTTWDAETSTVKVKKESPPKNEEKKQDEKVATPTIPTGAVDITSRFVGRRVTIRSVQNGNYVSARQDRNNSPLNAQAGTSGAWEIFEAVAYGNHVAFRANNEKYVSAILNDKYVPLRAVASKAQAWEHFKIYEYNGNHFIQTSNGRWLSARIDSQNSPLRGNADKKLGWERFTVAER